MIKSFKCRETQKIFHREYSTKFPHEIQKTALRKLWMLDAATRIADLRIPPANRLEALKGRQKGKYSIRINDQWRVCFEWHDNDAFNAEIIDYH